MVIQAPSKIYDICPSCNPRGYTKTTCSYTGEAEQVDIAGEIEYEYLYACDDCGSKLWVGEGWARRNAAKINKRP